MDLQELYQDLILDHGTRPRNRRVIEGADRTAEGYNPLCGDRVVVYLELENGTIRDASFTGEGCAICTASASMMTQHLAGRSADEARDGFEHFQRLLTGAGTDEQDNEALGKLSALAGVRRFPMRVKCATLPWHTMKAALDQRQEPVRTE